MKIKINTTGFVLALLVFVLILRSFFRGIGGDFPHLYQSMYRDVSFYPFAWIATGIGGFNALTLWVETTFALPVNIFGNFLHFPWVIITFVGFILPFFAIGFLSIYLLFKRVFPTNKLTFLAPLLFLANTYILMLIGGGQIMIALSYALVPAILLVVIGQKRTFPLLLGLLLALQLFFDLRLLYISLVIITIYLLVEVSSGMMRSIKDFLLSLIQIYIVPGLIVLGIHAFWILPIIFHHQNPIQQFGEAISSAAAVKFYSFATFENTLGFLHPNWPENIFGLTHFMRPEFLLLPILAFSSLFFLKKKQKTENMYVIYFVLLGLVGTFLAKGANDPFGGIYLWMFDHVPGFVMFRDPTKWYLLIALSYSMVIPYTANKIYDWLEEKFA